MTEQVAAPALDTCEIVWWSGYVKGRFQAYTSPSSLAPQLVDESPAIRWRSSVPPGPTDAAVEAFETLIGRLTEAGWVVTDRDADTWFAVVLARPAAEGTVLAPADQAVERDTDQEPEPAGEPRLETALLEQLRSDLIEARTETARERARRLEAESGALRLVDTEPVAGRPFAEPGSSRAPLLLVAYVLAVVVAAAIFLVGFHSLYAAVVAALTTAALAVALDSWLVAHRRIDAKPS
jgi:hypothetical protein